MREQIIVHLLVQKIMLERIVKYHHYQQQTEQQLLRVIVNIGQSREMQMLLKCGLIVRIADGIHLFVEILVVLSLQQHQQILQIIDGILTSRITQHL
jgi:hypothetical protein